MITLKRCARLAGLNSDALVIGVAPAARHHTLLKSYQLNLHHGRAAVRRMIVRDLLGCLDIGAQRCAADLLVVLRLFLSEEGDLSRRRRADRRPAREPLGLSRPSRADVAHPLRAWRELAETPLNAGIH
jgi:hypothetical protein